MRRIGYRYQRTLTATAEVRGQGIVTGAMIRLRFCPAPADTGILFIRTDLPGRNVTPARFDRVTDTTRRTTLGSNDTGITLVEHILAALAGLRIDNCVVELNGPEPPGLDGSAQGFVDAIRTVGMKLQPARKAIWAITDPIVVSQGGATIGLHPPTLQEPHVLRVSYILDYGPQAPIPRQAYSQIVTPDTFIREIAECRTFLLEKEAHALREQGIGRHLTPAQLLVFGPKGPMDNRLRFAEEPARHKVLDLIGDLSLCGFDLVGHIVAYRSGHALNAALAHALANHAKTPPSEVLVPAPARSAPRRRVAAA